MGHVASANAAFKVTGLMCRLLFMVLDFTWFNKLKGILFVLQPFLQMNFHK